MFVKFSMTVGNRCDFIKVGAWSVSALHSVRVVHIKVGVEDYSPSSLFGKILIFIFSVHMILAETTVKIIEFYTIKWE